MREAIRGPPQLREADVDGLSPRPSEGSATASRRERAAGRSPASCAMLSSPVGQPVERPTRHLPRERRSGVLVVGHVRSQDGVRRALGDPLGSGDRGGHWSDAPSQGPRGHQTSAGSTERRPEKPARRCGRAPSFPPRTRVVDSTDAGAPVGQGTALQRRCRKRHRPGEGPVRKYRSFLLLESPGAAL